MKLERRLLWLSLGVLLFGVVLNLALLVIYEQITYRDRILQDLKGRTEILGLNSAAALSFSDARAAKENLETLRATPAVELACLYDEREQILAAYSPAGPRCPLRPEPVSSSGSIRNVDAVRVQGQRVGSILMQEALPGLSQRLLRYSLLLMSSTGVQTLLVLLLVLALRARVLRPVNALAELAARVTEESDFAQRVSVSGNDEISALGTAVNRMLAAIEERAAAVRESAQLLQALIDHAPATITLKGGDGRYLLVNDKFAELAGSPGEALIGQSDDDIFDASVARARAELDRRVSEHGASQRTEEKLGDRIWLSERFALRNAAGQTYAVSAISTDITEQREMQASLAQAMADLTQLNESLEARVAKRSAELSQAMEQLVQSEKLASLGRLVAGVAHELNTPIGMVVTASSSLTERAREFAVLVAENRLSRSGFRLFLEDLANGTGLIEKNGLRAGRLINDFKQVAVDQTSMRRRVFRLDELIENTLHALGPMFKHTPHRIESTLAPDIECDSYPGALEQIVTNLIQNAILHGLDAAAPGLITLSAHQEQGMAYLSVRDNGRGIPEAALPHVFDPFFTTRLGEGGSGLGLYIVHNLARGVLGGKIEALNLAGGGAGFRVSFPLEAPRKGIT